MTSSLGPVALALALFAAPCIAAERQPFESVKGWDVERTVGDTSANPCLMSHAYEDKEDNNAANAVVFALKGEEAVLVVVYQGWDWDKDETVKVPFLLDKRMINAKSVWTGDGKTLRTKFADTVVPNLLAAKQIVLRFEDGEADFRIPDFAAGYEALRRCDAAAVRQAALASLPSESRMAAYAMGILLETVIKECEVSTTGKQRAAFEAKMAAVRPEMAAVEGTLRAKMKQDEAKNTKCPPAAEEAEFQTILRDFTEKSLEDFATALDKRETQAKTEPKPDAPKP